MGADLRNAFWKGARSKTNKETEDLIKGMLKTPQETANISNKNVDAQRQTAYISCFSPDEARNFDSVQNALQVRGILETEVLEGIESTINRRRGRQG